MPQVAETSRQNRAKMLGVVWLDAASGAQTPGATEEEPKGGLKM
jgi:hypothetical protein